MHRNGFIVKKKERKTEDRVKKGSAQLYSLTRWGSEKAFLLPLNTTLNLNPSHGCVILSVNERRCFVVYHNSTMCLSQSMVNVRLPWRLWSVRCLRGSTIPDRFLNRAHEICCPLRDACALLYSFLIVEQWCTPSHRVRRYESYS